MATELARVEAGSGTAAVHDLFALSDEQILEIEPEAQGVEIFGGERSDRMDPLREDLDLLADAQPHSAAGRGVAPSNGKVPDDSLPAAANDAAKTALSPNAEAPQWLAERMNDPRHGAEARELWQGLQAARQESAAFREVFAKPEEARAAADRASLFDEIDRAYFGVAGNAPEQTSASRAELAAKMLREDPAAFREMVFAGLRALENAGQQRPRASGPARAEQATLAGREANSAAQPARSQAQGQTEQPAQDAQRPQETQQPQVAPHQQEMQRQQEARLAAYASFERAANEELARGVSGAIARTLQEALPNAAKTETGAALKERLSAAIRQDVEKALQGDRALGEQVARILSGQRLDHATRAQVVRLIGDRAQQLVPGAARRVLADWTHTTLAAHGTRSSNSIDGVNPRSNAASLSGANANRNAGVTQQISAKPNANDRARESQRNSVREAATSRSPRKIDYRRVSDDDILDS